jgi:hypothetical protein
MSGTIRCFYTCHPCALVRQHVEVPERDPSTHDVVRWLKEIAAPALALDHGLRSPLCRRGVLDEVGIPVDEATERVGTKSSS